MLISNVAYSSQTTTKVNQNKQALRKDRTLQQNRNSAKYTSYVCRNLVIRIQYDWKKSDKKEKELNASPTSTGGWHVIWAAVWVPKRQFKSLISSSCNFPMCIMPLWKLGVSKQSYCNNNQRLVLWGHRVIPYLGLRLIPVATKRLQTIKIWSNCHAVFDFFVVQQRL